MNQNVRIEKGAAFTGQTKKIVQPSKIHARTLRVWLPVYGSGCRHVSA